MTERVFLCYQCRKLFRLPAKEYPAEVRSLRCPVCGDLNVAECNIHQSSVVENDIGPPKWEFVCRTCRTYFEVPSPREPDEVGNMRCAACLSRDIERFNIYNLENMEHTCFG